MGCIAAASISILLNLVVNALQFLLTKTGVKEDRIHDPIQSS